MNSCEAIEFLLSFKNGWMCCSFSFFWELLLANIHQLLIAWQLIHLCLTERLDFQWLYQKLLYQWCHNFMIACETEHSSFFPLSSFRFFFMVSWGLFFYLYHYGPFVNFFLLVSFGILLSNGSFRGTRALSKMKQQKTTT